MARMASMMVRDGPIVAAAIHAGHELSEPVAERMSLTDEERLREEDPFTDRLTRCASTRVVGRRSRFEVDLNRVRQESVYIDPTHSWGRDVWSRPPTEQEREMSRRDHDRFYAELYPVLREIERRHGGFVLLDLHSYNHMRSGEPADPSANPEVNLGTGTVDHQLWGSLIDRFRRDLSNQAGGLDVRENVKFKGRFLAAWVHATFPWTGCCLAIEFKKTFMDELTGEPFPDRIEALVEALRASVPGLSHELAAVTGGPVAETG